jgi:phosphatidate cytidylyltransferase
LEVFFSGRPQGGVDVGSQDNSGLRAAAKKESDRQRLARSPHYYPAMEKSLQNRLTYGPMMLAALFLLLWLDHKAQIWTRGVIPGGIGGTGLVVLLLIILPIATAELATLFTAEKIRPYRTLSAIGSGLLVLHAFCTQFAFFRPVAASSLAFVIVFVMLAAALMRALDQETQGAIHRMAGTVLATMYLGGLGWFLIALRVKHSSANHTFNGSTGIVLTILLTVKFTDIGAYFGGRATGRHKLIPWLSPGKTWEGLGWGLATAAGIGVICSRYVRPSDFHFQWWKGAIFGAVIGGVGQLGDLLESLMKRDAEVKDSGRLVPGFGGILDIIDSPLLAAPFAYLLFSLF